MPMAKGIAVRGILPTTTVSIASLASASNLYIKDPSDFLSGDIVGIADVNVAGNTNETRTISSITTISTTITDSLLVGGFYTSINVVDKTGFFIGLQFEIKGTLTNGDGTTSVFNEFVTVAGSFVSGTGPSVIPLTTTGQNSYLVGSVVKFSYITFTAPLTNAHPIGSLVSEINKAQNSSVALRYNRYGDLATTQMGDSHSAICNEGAYYKACSGKTSTEVISYNAPAVASTSPFFFQPTQSGAAMMAILNTGTYGAGIRIYLDFIKFIVVSPAFLTCAEQHYVITINNYDRYNSGAITDTTILPQIVNTNSDYPSDSIAKLFFSASNANLGLNTQPSGFPRVVARGIIKRNVNLSPAFLAGDSFSIDFGDHKTEGQTLIGAGTAQRMFGTSNSPIDIGPGQFLAFHMFRGVETNTTAATFHIEMGWWER